MCFHDWKYCFRYHDPYGLDKRNILLLWCASLCGETASKSREKNHCTLDHVALNQTLRQKQNNEITSKLFFSVLLKRRRWDGDLILSLRFLTHRRIQTHDLASSPITTRPLLLSRKSFVVTKL